MDAPKKNLRIGELLVKKGVVSSDQVRIALTEQQKNRTKEHLGKILVRLGFATEAIIRDVVGGALGQESIDLSKVVADSEAIKLIPKEMARRFHILPITYDNDQHRLTVAMADTFNVVALDQISAQLGNNVDIVPLLAGEAEILKAIDQFYGFELSVDGILHEIETGEIDYQSLDAESDEYSQPVVRLVNALFSDAVKRGASDIHFGPEQDFLRFRYRIDGVLRQVRSLHKNYWSAIAVRLKVMAGMDIAETRAPQDGRISLSLSGRPIDFRVSTLPTVHGENIVLRILDRQKGIVKLEELGLHDDTLETLRVMVARPEGIILVTGPTGSGKTTTLYSLLNYLNKESVNIMTLEDPVEYPTPMIRQTSVNEAIRLDFASGIRSVMRQDPDIVLVGEIRDVDTATMAFRAAMTGHQVFSTLHTNSAIGAIPRLLDIGILPDIMAGNIIGVIAQRLVRTLCRKCKEPYEPSDTERHLLGLKVTDRPQTIFRAKGCDECDHQGYKGRTALMELLNFDSSMDELIARRATRRELTRAALAKGFRPLAEMGAKRVLEGVTTLDEVGRVVDLTSRLKQ
ncbi:MAG: Flp pilus assembly complex ATPase component TadA [Gammaproteobacteria bacterium]|nr:Flp pilus assembly complex ATPase component TadA [Gammaproteobacteria bacterium]MCI0590661.1 Flp pilus assembly complex ATPase component TadA [Gammaproteobacteria bacterium]